MAGHRWAVALGVVAASGSQAEIVTLDATMTVDNRFTAYVSTDASVAGDSFLTGFGWQVPDMGSYEVTEAGTYYLHVFAEDLGDPMMFLGRFTLSNDQGMFEDGSQELLTSATSGLWEAGTDGFDGAFAAPDDLGANGTLPWGTFVSMGDANYIWAEGTSDTAYFRASFTVVPAPATLAGFGLLTLIGRRR